MAAVGVKESNESKKVVEHTWQEMDVREWHIQNSDKEFVSEWVNEAAKCRRLIGKVPRDETIQLVSNTCTSLVWPHGQALK